MRFPLTQPAAAATTPLQPCAWTLTAFLIHPMKTLLKSQVSRCLFQMPPR